MSSVAVSSICQGRAPYSFSAAATAAVSAGSGGDQANRRTALEILRQAVPL